MLTHAEFTLTHAKCSVNTHAECRVLKDTYRLYYDTCKEYSPHIQSVLRYMQGVINTHTECTKIHARSTQYTFRVY